MITCEKNTIESVIGNLAFDGYHIKNALNNIINSLDDQKESIEALAFALDECIKQYETAEQEIVSVSDLQEAIDRAQQDGTDTDVNEILDYILDALEQIVFGSWSDESNLLGTTVSVLLGLIPVLGMILDIRDFAGDIKNLCTDGATAEEWVCLGLDGLAIVLDFVDAGELVTPFKLGIKNTDEFTEIGKSISKHADEYVEIVKDIFQKNDWSKLGKGFVENARTYVDEILNITDTIKHAEDVMDMLTKSGRTANTLIQTYYQQGKDELEKYFSDLKFQFSL